MKVLLAGLVAATGVLLIPTANAKDFGPGDLRVCNKTRCIEIRQRAALSQLGSFYYGAAPVRRALPPALRSPYYELRFRNGYVTGIVATKRLDRFLSYGVNLDRFTRNVWYMMPGAVSEQLRGLTPNLQPLRLTRTALAKSH